MFARLCGWVLRLCGWRVSARFPDTPKFVMIIAHHTSNWDFPLGMLAAKYLRLDVNYLGKHTLFEGPFGWLFRVLGGIPVQRDTARNLSQQMAQRFSQSEALILAIAPEGTRSRMGHWKMGFWHIARAAGVPIAMVYLDYPRREIGGGDAFMPGDDLEADLVRIRAFFRDHRGRYPEKESVIGARGTENGNGV